MYLGISYLFKKIQSVIVSCDTRRRCTKKISRKCKTDSLMRRSVFKKVSKTEDFRVELFLQAYLNLVNFVLDRIYEATKKFKWKSIVFLLGLFLSWIISLPVVIIRTKLFCVIFQFQVKIGMKQRRVSKVDCVRLWRNRRKWSVVRPERILFLWYLNRQVQSPSPADIISVNVADVYTHTYLTNCSRAGPTSSSVAAVACYLKKQSLSHEITFRPDWLVHCVLTLSASIYVSIHRVASASMQVSWESQNDSLFLNVIG